MSIPDASPDFAAQKAVHSAARALFDQIRKALVEAGTPGAEAFDTLSLGMTADLDAAIQAGSLWCVSAPGCLVGVPTPA